MTAVAFIRQQVEMMNSWYVQDVKDLRRPGPFAEFAAADNDWLEHNARFSAWSTQPLVRFVAMPFNGEAKGARIAELMLRAGGVPDEQVARASEAGRAGQRESGLPDRRDSGGRVVSRAR